MAKTINLTKLNILKITLIVDRRMVIVDYVVTDDTGAVSIYDTATFYASQPTDGNGNPLPLSDKEYLIGAAHAQNVLDLYQAVRQAIISRHLT